MGTFSNNSITDVGRILLADVQAGAVFTPTRIVIGSGSMTCGATAQGMTDVITPVKSLAINKKKRTPDGKCVFGGVYTNEEVTEPFYFRELALYAKAVYLNEDGSVKSEGAETLYSYGNAGATADYMPAYSTSTVVEKQMDLVTWVGNDAQVDLTIESGIFITREQANGLGGDAKHISISTIHDLDPIQENGWYSFILPSTTQVNGVNFQYGYMRVDNFDSASCTQTIYVVDEQGTILRRKKKDNAWDEFECENPPFAVDVEYRTTERRNGKAVYKMLGSDGVLKYRLENETVWNTYTQETGAAPAGYGLGGESKFLSLSDNLNNIIKNGWYSWHEDTPINAPSAWGNMIVTSQRGHYTQTVILFASLGCVVQRTCVGDAWSEWEWVNPPLNSYEEYRTTDRHQGIAIYKKIDSNGNILWRKEDEIVWHLLSSASYVAPATVE